MNGTGFDELRRSGCHWRLSATRAFTRGSSFISLRQQRGEDIASRLDRDLLSVDAAQQRGQDRRLDGELCDALPARVHLAQDILSNPVGRLLAVAARFGNLFKVVGHRAALVDQDAGVVGREAELSLKPLAP